MLLNEFLKEHRKVEQMQKQIEALTAGLQRASAQLELNKIRTANGFERSVNVRRYKKDIKSMGEASEVVH